MKKIFTASAIISVLALTSCASIIQGKEEKVQVIPQPYQQANCTLANKRGNWSVQAPGQQTVLRSKTDLEVNCVNPATGAKGSKVVEPDLDSWMIGSVLFFWPISLPVDFGTGSAWDYDKDIQVIMSQPAVPPMGYAPIDANPAVIPQAQPVVPPVPAATPVQIAPQPQPMYNAPVAVPSQAVAPQPPAAPAYQTAPQYQPAVPAYQPQAAQPVVTAPPAGQLGARTYQPY